MDGVWFYELLFNEGLDGWLLGESGLDGGGSTELGSGEEGLGGGGSTELGSGEEGLDLRRKVGRR